MHAPTSEVDCPTIAIVTFASWMTVKMLTLAHVDTGDLVTLLLTIPRMYPEASTHAGLDVQFLTLVEANAIGVLRHKLKLITLG